MHSIRFDATHHSRSLTTVATAAIGVAVAIGALVTVQALGGTDATRAGTPVPIVAPDLAGAPAEHPSLLEGDPVAFDEGVAAEVRGLGRDWRTPSPGGLPSLLEGDPKAFDQALVAEVARLGLER